MKTLRLCFPVFCFIVLSCTTVSKVNYKTVNGYFVGNDVVEQGKAVQFVFTDSVAMNKIFHPAATMSNKIGKPDFSKEAVVGIALPAGTVERVISIDAIEHGNRKLKVFYIVQSFGKALSYSMKPSLLISVKKEDIDAIEVYEDGKLVKEFTL